MPNCEFNACNGEDPSIFLLESVVGRTWNEEMYTIHWQETVKKLNGQLE